MPKRITKICPDCAAFHNGKLPRKAAPLYEAGACDVCGKVDRLLSPKLYGLTDRLEFAIKVDRKVKKPLKASKPSRIHWLCEPCGKQLGSTKFRIHCAIWQDTVCDHCGKKTRCTEPGWFELKGDCCSAKH
jgi:ribosomal protein S14